MGTVGLFMPTVYEKIDAQSLVCNQAAILKHSNISSSISTLNKIYTRFLIWVSSE